ncbi:MAG TPA: pitrilysin family protein [Myxococcaceae bacterium]|nr:pitrilysin family protein [Myxococcaceae bacterium]
MTALLASLVLAATPPLVQLERYTLPNGLTVILTPDHRLPTVGVNLWYHVGGANEAPGRSGFAHLFEHLMFQGSKHRPGNEQDFAGLLEAAGSSDLNASTWNDRTNYFETLPANQLELALWLESERMAFLLDGLDQSKLDTQRDVVRNERRQSIENTPYGKAEIRLVELLFPKPHPYYGAVIGSHEDLQAATLEEVKAFFRTFYVPANASLVIAGDFDPAQARTLVEKYFGPIPRSPPPAPPAVRTLPVRTQIRETLTDDVQLSRLFVGVIAPPAWSDEGFAYDVAQEILAGGKTGRLYRALVFDHQVAQDVDIATDKSTFGSESEIRITVKPGHLPAEVETLLDAEIDRLASSPPTDAELHRAQRNIEARLYRALERLNGNGGRADLLNAFQMWRDDPGFVNQVVAHYRAVTPAQVQESVRKSLARDARVVLIVNPAAPPTASAR